jgi:putative aminopeptidase FrvX
MDAVEKLLKELTEASGVSGFEAEVRAVIRGRLAPVAAIEQDRLGSIICRLSGASGASGGPRVMLAAHMDEIGFMVRLITEEGFLKFVPLGGWWNQVMLAQRVVVKTAKGDLIGITGAKPPHLISAKERDVMVDKKEMYIDVGATSADEARALGVQPGDPVIPVSGFSIMGNPKTYMAKALDDRVGCAVFIQAMTELAGDPGGNGLPNTVYGVGTVQEEVGLRGATTSVELVKPDVAIVLEADIAGDVPGIKPEDCATKLGKGPALVVYDARMIPNAKLRRLVIDTAAENSIPLQLSALEGGGTDGGAIHIHAGGVPVVVIGVPARHIHSHAGIMHRDDYDAAVRLVKLLVRKLDRATVDGLTA